MTEVVAVDGEEVVRIAYHYNYAHAVPLSWLHAYNSEVRHGATRISTMSINERRVGGDA